MLRKIPKIFPLIPLNRSVSIFQFPYTYTTQKHSLAFQFSYSSSTSSSSSKPPSISQIQHQWDTFSTQYNNFDYCPQTLYYSLLYMLQVYKGNKILEVACGTGKLLPIAINMKNIQTAYHATDLSENMVKLALKNLKQNYSKYYQQGSNNDKEKGFQLWMKRNNLRVFQCNAQEPFPNNSLNAQGQKYDRIICNCVLMITENAEKMLKNLYKHAEKGCLLGVSVWGNKDNNNLMTSIRQSYLEANVPLPDQRSNFHLYKKVSKLAQACGWETVLNWEQNALFPALSADSEKYKSFFFHQVDKIQNQGKREEVKKILMEKIQRNLKEKKGLNFSCDMYVLRKK